VHDFFADVIREASAVASSMRIAIPSPRRGSSSPAACSQRSTAGLGGLLGDDLLGVRASRQAWMLADVVSDT